MAKKVGVRKALQFFENNIIMFSSCEAKGEEGCAEKCMNMLKMYVGQNCKNIDKESEVSQ